MDETVELLWSKVEEAWDEDKRHQAFLMFCQQNQLLGEAARRYRAIAEAPPSTSTSPSERGDAEPTTDTGEGGVEPSPPAEPQADAAAVEKRRAEAKKRLTAIALLAMATLDAQRSAPPKQPRWLRILAIAIFLGAMGMLGWALTKLGASP